MKKLNLYALSYLNNTFIMYTSTQTPCTYSKYNMDLCIHTYLYIYIYQVELIDKSSRLGLNVEPNWVRPKIKPSLSRSKVESSRLKLKVKPSWLRTKVESSRPMLKVEPCRSRLNPRESTRTESRDEPSQIKLSLP